MVSVVEVGAGVLLGSLQAALSLFENRGSVN